MKRMARIEYREALDEEVYYSTEEDVSYPEFLEDAIFYHHNNKCKIKCVILTMDDNENIVKITKLAERKIVD